MKRHHGSLLSDSRPRRVMPRLLGLAALAGLGLVALVVATAGEDQQQTHESRIERLDTPTWHSDELNRPAMPGAIDDDGVELSVAENNDDPLHVVGKVQRDQTLFVALRDRGLLPDRIQPVVNAMSTVFDFRRSRPGDTYEVRLDLDGNVLEFRYQTSLEDIYTARLVGDQYVAEKLAVPRETVTVRVAGSISGSVYQTFAALGEKAELAQTFMDLFAGDFDFGSDSQMGDRFQLIVEKVYLNGEFYRYGRLIGGTYQAADRTLAAYYFSPTPDQEGEYFDAEGYSLRRMFLKTPVRGVKMTSGFDRKRFHPVLKRYRPHLGVDYAGPTGTPVMAIADGVVDFVGWKGGNGNLVMLTHDHGYQSAYAHLHRFARGIKPGKEIKQKEIIGYIGNTGLSTGPHLHFGIKKDGNYIDPLTIDHSRGERLRGNELTHYLQERERLQSILDGKTALVAPSATPPSPDVAAVH